MSITDGSLSRRSFISGLFATAALAKPLGERLFFAGEAVAAPYYQLCAGAYTSGENAAHKAVAAIG